MNCCDFEKVVNDLAEDNLMEASIKEKAMAHAKSCMRCVARLSKEKFLTDSLRFAAKADTAHAPANVKANLLAAFQAQHSNSNVVVFAPVQKRKSFTSCKWAIAATIMIMLLGFAATQLLNTKSKSEGQATTPTPEKVKQSLDNKTVGTTANNNANQKDKKQSPQTPFQKKVNKVSERKTVAVVPRIKSPETSVDKAKKNEITSDYIALTYVDETSAIDSGMVVRVKVPRTTLIAMGLQLNTAQTDGYVKADLVLGDDGVARAIRLVQDSSTTEETKEQ